MRNVVAALSGGLFGLGLLVSGMTNTTKVQGWLDVFGDWDPTLAFVMGGAILPMFIAWRIAARGTPKLGGAFPAPAEAVFGRDLFDHELEKGVPVSGGQTLGIVPVDFELAIRVFMVVLIGAPPKFEHVVANFAHDIIAPHDRLLVVAGLFGSIIGVADLVAFGRQKEILSFYSRFYV